MNARPHDERQLPYGVADLFFEEAARKTRVESRFGEACARWGYSQVIPPTFEYYETLAAEASPQVREETYRFFDRDGRTLALRADPTIPIARMVATKLASRPLPLRFFYVASVFRYEEPRAANRREFTQAGVELIGAASPAADAEILALSVETLRAMGLADLRLRVGHMGLLQALLAEAELEVVAAGPLQRALERASPHLLDQALAGRKMNPAVLAALRAIPTWRGTAPVVEQAGRDCASIPAALAALDHLREVIRHLEAYDLLAPVVFDLGMARGMDYYTGLIFEGFTPRLGFGLASGGRYDRLIAHFGRDLPAMGFAIGVERLLAALDPEAVPVALGPEVLVESSPSRDLVARAADARAAGRRVELGLPGGDRGALLAQARERGAREVWFADGSVEILAHGR